MIATKEMHASKLSVDHKSVLLITASFSGDFLKGSEKQQNRVLEYLQKH